MQDERTHSVPLPNGYPAKDPDGRVVGAVQRGGIVEILVDGQALRAHEGETVAAALLAIGQRVLRTTARRSEPRGIYCGIGNCFDCVMTIDGQLSVRTCQTFVRRGMCVDSQQGEGVWRIEP